ncbi:MAG: FAD-dependent oxidoreductase, partial [Desulfobacterales bacterium]
GDAVRFVRRQMREEGLLGLKYTFSGSVYFERMKARGLYSTEPKQIAQRVGTAGLSGIFAAR